MPIKNKTMGLKTGYDKFHNKFNELTISVDKTSGEYRF